MPECDEDEGKHVWTQTMVHAEQCGLTRFALCVGDIDISVAGPRELVKDVFDYVCTVHHGRLTEGLDAAQLAALSAQFAAIGVTFDTKGVEP